MFQFLSQPLSVVYTLWEARGTGTSLMLFVFPMLALKEQPISQTTYEGVSSSSWASGLTTSTLCLATVLIASQTSAIIAEVLVVVATWHQVYRAKFAKYPHLDTPIITVLREHGQCKARSITSTAHQVSCFRNCLFHVSIPDACIGGLVATPFLPSTLLVLLIVNMTLSETTVSDIFYATAPY